MTEQQIIEWAREAGFESNDSGDYAMDSTAWVCDVESIDRFAELVAAHERERCAKICDEASIPNPQEIHTDAQWAAKCLAMSIRALKD